MSRYSGLIERYRQYLPIEEGDPVIELGEGNTPLIKLVNIPALMEQHITLYVKYEGLNPTGSFKDRGMTMAVSKAVSGGAKAIICASTGNTSAAAAAYAARAGIQSFVVIPDGKIAMGKLAQALISGTKVLKIKGNFDDGMRLVKQVSEQYEQLNLVNSVNPYRLQGQKTAAFEIIEELGGAPDYHALPVGNAGNISAYWMGYKEFKTAGKSDVLPTILGYQASGSAPFVRGKMVENPETVATAIRIGVPQSYDLALQVEKESGGWFTAISDEKLLAAQKLLTQKEGVFCEPASATSVAGVMADVASGKIKANSTVVCTLTGHGLKDPDMAATQSTDSEVLTIDATLSSVESAILDSL